MPIIIYKFILCTSLREQLTFTSPIYNHTNAAHFKAGGLKNLLGIFLYV